MQPNGNLSTSTSTTTDQPSRGGNHPTPAMNERMNTMYRAYHKNPNRWMINHVPVRQERHIDWIAVIGFISLIAVSTWFAMFLQTV